MGNIAKVLSFIRVVRNLANISDVKVDPGGGDIVTGVHFAPAGDDAHPLPDDYAIMMAVQGAGREAIVGYSDPENTPVTAAGEKRIYARKADGTPINQVWLRANGDIILDNENGSITLNADGSITITAGGDISITGGDILADGVSLKNHVHDILSGSSAPGPTGPAK